MVAESDRREAFERLFETHYWSVRDFTVRRVPDEAVEDVVAETFLVAWRRFDELDGEALPWLLGVARRVVANQLRADRRRGALAERVRALLSPAVSDWQPPQGLSSEVAEALAGLSDREREALLLVAWEGLDPRRAALVVGCSVTAFRVRLHRARRRVAAQLGAVAVPSGEARVPQEVP